MYYHASQTEGIRCLKPRVSNHGISLVYLSAKRENVLVYLSNAVEKCCKETGFAQPGKWTKWGPYGFTKEGILRLEEYYPNALEETYKGVSAYIYSADVTEGIRKLEGIPDAYVSESPVPVQDCEYIPDAYAQILQSQAKGEILICRYADMTQSQLQWIHDTAVQEYTDEQTAADYKYFLLNKFPFLRTI